MPKTTKHAMGTIKKNCELALKRADTCSNMGCDVVLLLIDREGNVYSYRNAHDMNIFENSSYKTHINGQTVDINYNSMEVIPFPTFQKPQDFKDEGMTAASEHFKKPH